MMYFDDDEVIEMKGKKKKLARGSTYNTNNNAHPISYMEIEGNYSTEPIPAKKKLFSCSFVTLFFYVIAISLFFFMYYKRSTSHTSSDKYIDSTDGTGSISVNDNENVSNDNTEPVDTTPSYAKPNIVFILTDDQGMGDMDLTGNELVGLMPNIRALNYAGLNFTHHYVHTQCSPSRAALLTGLYSTNTGMFHSDIQGTQPWGLPLMHKLMPEYLLKAGFRSTYHLGKWHLGHYSDKHIPTARGFNFSLGFYGGYQHPKNYKYEYIEFAATNSEIPDMHLNGKKYETSAGESADYFNSYLITDIAEAVIFQEGIVQKTNEERGVQKEPFFLLFAPPLISAPIMPDDSLMSNYKLSYIQDSWRKKTAGMLVMLDDIVGRVVKALDTAGLTDNTIIIFTSDNGAVCAGNHNGAGSNYPLRGCRGSVFEGASRVPAFVYSPLLGHSLTRTGKQNTGMFHISDWLPTIVEGMLGKTGILPSGLDGINQFPWMLSFTDTSKTSEVSSNFASPVSKVAPRTEVLYNIDPYTGISAIRVGNYKLILNETASTGWFNSTHFGRELCNGVWITVNDPTGVPSFPPTRKPTTMIPTRVPTTHTPTFSIQPTAPTLQPSNTLTPSTAAPSAPTCLPTHVPTRPTVKPTSARPTTHTPSVRPSTSPTNATAVPTTIVPTAPTYIPSRAPTGPTVKPSTTSPTTSAPSSPTIYPTAVPSNTSMHTVAPSGPSVLPTQRPSSPSLLPSASPTTNTTVLPTTSPSVSTKPTTHSPTAPTVRPSRSPTRPTCHPTSAVPSISPSTVHPTAQPTNATFPPSTHSPTSPTLKPTSFPTQPSPRPTSLIPTVAPTTVHPTVHPTNATQPPVTRSPTGPSLKPTRLPTHPTVKPTSLPPTHVPSSSRPTTQPTNATLAPIAVVSITPSVKPTLLPSVTRFPTSPTLKPTLKPTGPTFKPSTFPSFHATGVPTVPTLAPSVDATDVLAQTMIPTAAATLTPTVAQTVSSSTVPTASPSVMATTRAPSRRPSYAPSGSYRPTTYRPSAPTNKPFTYPTRAPTTIRPSSAHPSVAATFTPTIVPSVKSTSAPTESPKTLGPTVKVFPSISPSVQLGRSTAPVVSTNAPTAKKASPSQSPSSAPVIVTMAPSLRTSKPTKSPTRPAIPTEAPTTKTPFFTIASKSPSHTSQPSKKKSLREHRALASTNGGSSSTTAPTQSGWYVTNSVMLFDLSADEQERHDISSQHPDIVASLMAELMKYKSKMSAKASCDVSDSSADKVWSTANSVEPWITLTSEKTDYVCPSTIVTSVNCEWV